MIKRLLDIIFALIGIMIFMVPYLFILSLVKTTSSGPIIYWSKRLGRDGKLFMMPKFRTMKINTPELSTNKLNNAKQYLTPIGSFLRRTSLDETPQFFSVLKGDMSLVGPRPALYNENDVILKRKKLGIDVLKPGITGWAQINGRDEITLKTKIELDYEYFKKQSISFDFFIILRTIVYVINSKNIIH